MYNYGRMLRALNQAVHTDIDLTRLTRNQKVDGVLSYSANNHHPSRGGKYYFLTYYNFALSVIYKDQSKRNSFF